MNSLVLDAEKFVVSYLNEHLNQNFVYHNLSHTQRVVAKTKELIEYLKLPENNAEQLLIAAWFHDTGFTKTIVGHEKESVAIANKFLDAKGASEDSKKIVKGIILATQMDYNPKNELETIIRDADCAHVSSKNYDEFAELLRKEWELTQNKTFTNAEWLESNITFLMQHHKFHSDAALSRWDKQKGKNLAQLLKTQKKLEQEQSKLMQKREELDFKKNKIELPERGIETMFRVALRNHITLSDIADTKANILLSVNAIVISLVLSNLVSKLDNPSNDYLIWPTVIFAVFTVASIVLSVLATRPNVTQGKFSKQDVADKKVNLLFFGNFHKMKLDEFEWAMGEMMKDRDYLYGSLTKDLYFLGLVLNRKYNLLRTTYTVFMLGIVISVIAFAVAFYLQSGDTNVQTVMHNIIR